MTKEQLAAMLGGRKYGSEITDEESACARRNGLVVVFGASDDLMKFEGAIYDEVGCYDGGEAFLTPDGLFESDCDNEDCPFAEREKMKCKTIEAVWCGKSGASWEYYTDIPHTTFNIYYGYDLYCVGIVFELSALKEG